MRIITDEELKTHNKKEDLWIAVNGFVYDITNFLQYHPGTEEPLLKYAGSDATEQFNKTHPDINISQINDIILMGELATNVD